MAEKKEMASSFLTPRELSLPGRPLPPALPLIISCQDSWDPDCCKLVTTQQDNQDNSLKVVKEAMELLQTIDKPLAVLSICGPYRSGKSYFLSRLLGKPGAFQLGHTMRACTRGIWMATTILECQQFAIVMLDTEGTDAVKASETMAMSLLTLTTLLSSYLIYNSKKVPQKVDLDKMRCFTQLSTSILAQRGDSMSTDAMKKFFPHFLWLLRDVTLAMTNRQGEKIPPTEFLHTRVLASESGHLTALGRFLCSLFPSLECHSLPMPSINPKVTRNIVELQAKLKPAFNTAIEQLIHQILQQVAPKKAIDGVSTVNGSALAALARGYVDAINTPGAIPDLEQGWMAVVKLQLKEHTEKLVVEYEREMEESLRGNLPMEERNIMRIHEITLNKMKRSLEQESFHINPLNSSPEDVEPLLKELENAIVKWDKEEELVDDIKERKIIGGVLFQFVTRNFSESKRHCEELFNALVKDSKFNESCNEAIQNSIIFDISGIILSISEAYNKKAIGPAAKDVLEKGHKGLNEMSKILKKVPGVPQEVGIIGIGPDRIKLSWKPPKHNPKAAEKYIVSKRKGDEGMWEEIKTTKKTKFLIVGLKSDHKYQFNVRATNSLLSSLGSRKDSWTMTSKFSNVFTGALRGSNTSVMFGAAVLGAAMETIGRYDGLESTAADYINSNIGEKSSLLFGTATLRETMDVLEKYDTDKSNPSDEDSAFLFAGMALATLPISLLLAPVTMPLFVVCGAAAQTTDSNEGDLTPVSDDEA